MRPDPPTDPPQTIIEGSLRPGRRPTYSPIRRFGSAAGGALASAPAPLRSWFDAIAWGLLAVAGLALAAVAVARGAHLETASPPFLGWYRWQVGPGTVLAPILAIVVIVTSARGWLERVNWPALQVTAYLTAVAWASCLALVDGAAGFTRGLSHRQEPPGQLLLLWALRRLGPTDHLLLGLVVTAIGALTVPLVLAAVRDACGELAARRYAPVLCLAPYAVWLAVSLDAVVATLGAAGVVAGVRASRRRSRGWAAAGWASLAGLLTGCAVLFSAAAPWLGLSLVFLYFARRRPFLNLATGFGVLVPVLAVQWAGYGWVEGLSAVSRDQAAGPRADGSALWWAGLSLATLLLATGPPVVASARKLRNTPAWPFLVGAAAAVIFSLLAGLSSGGVERSWLPFFPWLTIAAVAPESPGGPPAPPPVPLVAVGAVVAILIEALLATPW